jgi:hypothetical protein
VTQVGDPVSIPTIIVIIITVMAMNKKDGL